MTKQNERRNNRRRLEVEIDLSVMLKGVRKQIWENCSNRAVKVCCAYADADQGKHVGASINHRTPGAREKDAATPEDNNSCQDQLGPLVDSAWQPTIKAQTWNHVAKRQEEQRDR